MVRQLLGNIRGPRGEQGQRGVQGDPGGFNGEIIGVNNLINLKDFEPYDSSSSLSYNLNDGVLYYHNHPYSFGMNIELTPGDYTFRVEDFTINPDYASGRIRFSITYDGTDQTTILLNPGDTHSFTITTSGTHRVVILVSNVSRVDGQIEKMMLVKGEYTSGWQPSLKDQGINKTKAFVECRHYTNSIVSETTTQFGIWNFDSNMDNITSSGGVITLPPGRYIIDYNGYLFNGTGTLRVNLVVNGSNVAFSRYDAGQPISINKILRLEETSDITVTYYYTDTEGYFAPDWRNQTTITEL